NGEFGTEAEFVARRIGEDIHAPADVLAGHIEKDVGRLQRGGRDGLVARLLETAAHGSRQRLAGAEPLAVLCCHGRRRHVEYFPARRSFPDRALSITEMVNIE